MTAAPTLRSFSAELWEALTVGKIIKFRKRRKPNLPQQWQAYRAKPGKGSWMGYAIMGVVLGGLIGIGIVAAPSMENAPVTTGVEFPDLSTGASPNGRTARDEMPTPEDRSVSTAQADRTAQTTNVAPPPARSFALCHIGGGTNCVVDGDTIWMDGVKIRVADIDAPETHPPRCPQEADLGNRATERLYELVNQGPFTAETMGGRDEDRYGRKLRVLMRNGQSLGGVLVAEGLAQSWDGARHPWC